MSIDRRTFLTAAPAALAPAPRVPPWRDPAHAARYQARHDSEGCKLARRIVQALKHAERLCGQFLDQHGDGCDCGFCVAGPDIDGARWSSGEQVEASIRGSQFLVESLICAVDCLAPPARV